MVGVGDMQQECDHSDHIQTAFFSTLTGSLLGFFRTKHFSEVGSNSLRKEQATYIYFRDVLEEIEGKCLDMGTNS